MGINRYALFGLIVRLICTSIIAFYVVPKQVREVMRPKNQFTKLRWILLSLFCVSVLFSVPSIAYQALRIFGHDSHVLRNFVTISANISTIATTWLLVLIYRYKVRIDE